MTISSIKYIFICIYIENILHGVEKMVNYQKLYAYLVGEIDKALTLLDDNNLFAYPKVKSILQDALWFAEDMYLEETEE